VSTSPQPLETIEVDASRSYSPHGSGREPLEYQWSVVDDQGEVVPGFAFYPPGEGPVDGLDPLGVWTLEAQPRLFVALAGTFKVRVSVRDNMLMESVNDTAFAETEIISTPTERFYAELIWDDPAIDLDLVIGRRRGDATLMVLGADEDLANGGASCNVDRDCSPYFCSVTGDGSKRCTLHSDVAHNDTCFDGVPNPSWSDAQNQDDDPRLRASSENGGPEGVSISRPHFISGPPPSGATFRVFVRMHPQLEERTVSLANPVTATVRIHMGGQITVYTQPLWFRSPENKPELDRPFWKVVDVDWMDRYQGTLRPIPSRDEDCLLPFDCPYANPFNAVNPGPIDPNDPTAPNSAYCDEPGDVDCPD
jgi:hypothetical protein